jgi:hypothetical protein
MVAVDGAFYPIRAAGVATPVGGDERPHPPLPKPGRGAAPPQGWPPIAP